MSAPEAGAAAGAGGPTLYLIRHGETAWNQEGRLQGSQDIPLNDRGRAQAAEAAARLRGIVARPESFAYVASPLVRARETMELLRAALGLDPAAYAVDDRWREIGFGIWEGLTWKDVRRLAPAAHAARAKDPWNGLPPGGESYAGAAERVRGALDALTGDTVIVAHGGTARVALALRCGVATERAPKVDIWQGRVLVVRGGRFAWI